ncbi:hypothetical protein MIMGU_mgv1a022942mg [Erythranthe guttata]|uniref:MATH domain-containing protein n=1 Tax=Erythranthe guttata TaxID=4155 RepID=A0A022QCC0_ERYGU|nr:hypothetical protein MIMGU_mgv1a022942mg [Erythranthe guttata]
METREAPPAHLLVKIESFSLLGTCGIDEYETREFVAGHYKWGLIIYFNGKNCEYVSVSLAMADTSSLPANWEVNVVFNIFLYNQISGNYLSSPGVFFMIPKEFTDMKNKMFLKNKGFVVKKDAIIECVSLNNINIHYKHDFKIPDFSKLNERCFSEQFIAGGQKWKIILDPKGSGTGTDNHVSIFLNHLVLERVQAYFTLATINDPNKGFIVNDYCLLSIDIHVQVVANIIN